jgi:hypothetical protein
MCSFRGTNIVLYTTIIPVSPQGLRGTTTGEQHEQRYQETLEADDSRPATHACPDGRGESKAMSNNSEKLDLLRADLLEHATSIAWKMDKWFVYLALGVTVFLLVHREWTHALYMFLLGLLCFGITLYRTAFGLALTRLHTERVDRDA